MEASATAADPAARDWASLPAAALQHVVITASTRHSPGTFLGAPVCRAWRSAAAGCKGIRLLYSAGHPATDESFIAWLRRNSQQLDAFVVSCNHFEELEPFPFSGETVDNWGPLNHILNALADAAAAAMATGGSLPLRTLRVLSCGLDSGITRRLLVHLPHLRCLQLDATSVSSEDAAALQQATRLRELYLTGEFSDASPWPEVARVLPASLERLSVQWVPMSQQFGPDLSHLTRVTFLHLRSWEGQQGVPSSNLPPGLKQLELWGRLMRPSLLQQERGVLTRCAGWGCGALDDAELQVLSSYTNLRFLSAMSAGDLRRPKVCAAVRQLVNLSAMEVVAVGDGRDALEPLMPALRSCQGLRCLHLRLEDLQQQPRQLATLTQLTQLKVSDWYWGGQVYHALPWVVELRSMPQLRWLSVPAQLLEVDQAWLVGLEQLQVLALHGVGQAVTEQVLSQGFPPRLQLLGLCLMTAYPAEVLKVRRRLQRQLSSSGFEVVVGFDLDELCDPIKQLAGLPVALQQALA